MQTWMDMASAPKDGSKILLLLKNPYTSGEYSVFGAWFKGFGMCTEALQGYTGWEHNGAPCKPLAWAPLPVHAGPVQEPATAQPKVHNVDNLFAQAGIRTHAGTPDNAQHPNVEARREFLFRNFAWLKHIEKTGFVSSTQQGLVTILNENLKQNLSHVASRCVPFSSSGVKTGVCLFPIDSSIFDRTPIASQRGVLMVHKTKTSDHRLVSDTDEVGIVPAWFTREVQRGQGHVVVDVSEDVRYMIDTPSPWQQEARKQLALLLLAAWIQRECVL